MALGALGGANGTIWRIEQMKIDRRTFVKGSAAAIATLGLRAAAGDGEVGKPLPAWKPGDRLTFSVHDKSVGDWKPADA